MKYTIELTNKQRAVLESLLEIIHRHIGFNAKLEPMEIVPIKDTQAYKQGFEDGKNEAIHNTDLIEELKQAEYNMGYNSAINDYNAMYEWLHDCFVDFEKFLLEKGFYTDEKFLDGFVVGQLMYDLICDLDIAEVIAEFKKWIEEKKKAEEETVKVGDVVECMDAQMIVTRINPITKTISGVYKDGEFFNRDMTKWHKTGKHYDIESILKELGE